MVAQKQMEYYTNRAKYLDAVQAVVEQIDPTVSHLAYKVNTNTGGEAVEVRYKSGVVKRIDVGGLDKLAVLRTVLRRCVRVSK